jgi:hypothetical protein
MPRWQRYRRFGPILVLAGALMGAGCAVPGGGAGPAGVADPVPAAAVQLAADLADADAVVERTIGRIGEFAQRNRREAAAIAYATGGRIPPSGRAAAVAANGTAAVAAGDVLAPAFDALVLHGRRLAGLAGELPPGLPDPDPAQLRREVEQGLARYEAALRRRLPLTAAEREAGLAAVATLAVPPAEGADFADYVSERQPAVEALTVLLRAVIGADPQSGLRARLAAEREEAMRAQAALLAAARRDSSLGVLGRYALYHSAMRAEAELPTDAVLAAAVGMLSALPAAHAALASADPAAAAQRVAAFSAAVDRLEEAEWALERAAAE